MTRTQYNESKMSGERISPHFYDLFPLGERAKKAHEARSTYLVSNELGGIPNGNAAVETLIEAVFLSDSEDDRCRGVC